MDTREKRYRKIAKSKAREYLKNKKRYKTKSEKKAFKIAEKFRIKEWKASLSLMNADEAQLQLKAFKIYRARVNLIRNLIVAGLALIIAVVLLIVLL